MPAASRHTRRIVTAVLVPAAVATLVAMFVLWPGRVRLPADPAGASAGVRVLATVTSVSEQTCPPAAAGGAPAPGWVRHCGSAVVRVAEGPRRGQPAAVDLPQGPGAPVLSAGDDVVLLYYAVGVPGGRDYTVIDH